MITKEKVEIFNLYNGEIDSFGHGKKKDRKLLSDDEFLTMVQFKQDILLVERKLTSIEFASRLEKNLEDEFENQEAISFFRKLVI
jgi:hypothetical protein